MVAEDETQKVETGIPTLDKALSGGLESAKIYLISGEAGTGKTIFSTQYVYTGLKNGENAIFVTVTEKPQEVLNDAKAMGWDLSGYVDDSRDGQDNNSHNNH